MFWTNSRLIKNLDIMRHKICLDLVETKSMTVTQRVKQLSQSVPLHSLTICYLFQFQFCLMACGPPAFALQLCRNWCIQTFTWIEFSLENASHGCSSSWICVFLLVVMFLNHQIDGFLNISTLSHSIHWSTNKMLCCIWYSTAEPINISQSAALVLQ